MPDDLGISSMHLSGKLFQMINNKNKTMIVEMKAPSVKLKEKKAFCMFTIYIYSPSCAALIYFVLD
jgi:hypothetical protein